MGINGNGNGVKAAAILRWWPVIAFAIIWVSTGLGAFYSVKMDMRAEAVRLASVEKLVAEHEIRQRVEREELLYEVRELRNDVKRMMEAQATLLRDLK